MGQGIRTDMKRGIIITVHVMFVCHRLINKHKLIIIGKYMKLFVINKMSDKNVNDC